MTGADNPADTLIGGYYDCYARKPETAGNTFHSTNQQEFKSDLLAVTSHPLGLSGVEGSDVTAGLWSSKQTARVTVQSKYCTLEQRFGYRIQTEQNMDRSLVLLLATVSKFPHGAEPFLFVDVYVLRLHSGTPNTTNHPTVRLMNNSLSSEERRRSWPHFVYYPYILFLQLPSKITKTSVQLLPWLRFELDTSPNAIQERYLLRHLIP